MASVNFREPANGATVPSSFDASFGVSGMEVKPSGDMTPNTGHFCLIIDGAPVPKGQVVPVAETSIHYGKGQTRTTVNLSPGQHTLTLQFDNGAHLSYGPDLSQTITVTVQ
ncbi:DUF4399 domain-containing protein [Nocardia sp. NBC_01499]